MPEIHQMGCSGRPAAPAGATNGLRNRKGSGRTAPGVRQGVRRREIARSEFFISYRRSERDSADLAQFLADRLQAAGHEIFIDVGIPVGTDWVAEITQRIDWCDYLIVLLSDAARTSEMVQGEVRMAHRRLKRDGKPGILPSA